MGKRWGLMLSLSSRIQIDIDNFWKGEKKKNGGDLKEQNSLSKSKKFYFQESNQGFFRVGGSNHGKHLRAIIALTFTNSNYAKFNFHFERVY